MEKLYLAELVDIVAEMAANIDEHHGKQICLRVLALHEAINDGCTVKDIYDKWDAERKANLKRTIDAVQVADVVKAQVA